MTFFDTYVANERKKTVLKVFQMNLEVAQIERLTEIAHQSKTSVAELIRQSITKTYPAPQQPSKKTRAQATK
jgi:hypothetical protein